MLDDALPAFEGNDPAARAFLRKLTEGSFYTYVLLDPAGQPFYVGKGKGLRALQHAREAMRRSNLPKANPYKCAKIRGILRGGGAIRYRIDRVYAEGDQKACLIREEALIAKWRRRSDGGVLTNLAAGLGSLFAPDPFSIARHAATLGGVSEERPERTAVNLFLRSLGGLDSVPIKPLSEYRSRLVAAYPSPKALKSPTRRNGLTLAAAALAQGARLRPGVRLARCFDLLPDPDDWPLPAPPPARVPAVIENGAMSDVLKLGLCTLVPAARPADESVTLDAAQIATLVRLIGPGQMQEWDLI